MYLTNVINFIFMNLFNKSNGSFQYYHCKTFIIFLQLWLPTITEPSHSVYTQTQYSQYFPCWQKPVHNIPICIVSTKTQYLQYFHYYGDLIQISACIYKCNIETSEVKSRIIFCTRQSLWWPSNQPRRLFKSYTCSWTKLNIRSFKLRERNTRSYWNHHFGSKLSQPVRSKLCCTTKYWHVYHHARRHVENPDHQYSLCLQIIQDGLNNIHKCQQGTLGDHNLLHAINIPAVI